MRNEHLSSVENKVNELLTAEDLAATCRSSSKWDIISHHSINAKSAGQLSGFFVEGWRTNTSHLSRKKSPNCLQLKTWLQLVWPDSNETWSVNTQDLSKIQGSTIFCRRINVSHQQLNFEITKKLSQEESKVLGTAWPAWTRLDYRLDGRFWNQHSLLGMGSCSILAITNKYLFHVKITHIENCFCNVEQSLPLA